SLTGIKGLSEAKVDKIYEAAEKLVSQGFMIGSDLLLKRKSVVRITTGCQALDELLGKISERSKYHGSSRRQPTHVHPHRLPTTRVTDQSGGGDGVCWFDTVNCYDRTCDDWTICPSLTRDKASLAGVSLNGKIYTFGGRDGNQCFSDVEVFDPVYGKWIKYQPMLGRRFALAGTELNGAIYAVSGFSGVQYLRFSIGGYDAEAKAMAATVECLSIHFQIRLF
ncbi:hypothetical protein ABZP36_000257, partial [Zizania latifolia]